MYNKAPRCALPDARYIFFVQSHYAECVVNGKRSRVARANKKKKEKKTTIFLRRKLNDSCHVYLKHMLAA